jgi:hypothetical protein
MYVKIAARTQGGAGLLVMAGFDLTLAPKP